jgi:CheY-like chemotaxis protein
MDRPGGPRPRESDALAAAIHETTNALTVILGWIERAREGTDGEAADALARAARYTRTARHAMRRAIGAEVPAVDPELADVLTLRITEDLAAEARRAHVTLRRDLAPHAATLAVAHPDVAWQILTNLILNAIAHAPPDSEVLLRGDERDGQVLFEVLDHGPGIAPAERAQLFVSGVSTRPGGAGVGLRHGHDLAREHGGALSLRDSQDGAHFALVWPRAEGLPSSGRPAGGPAGGPPGRDQRAPGAPHGNLDGANVLLLEDDAAVVELLELSLGARGAAVTTVTSAEALASALDSGAYDVMLVDLSPLATGGAADDPNGLDAAIARAKRANPRIDVVVISGSVTVQPRPDIVWVRKPFEPRELVAAIIKHRTPPRG